MSSESLKISKSGNVYFFQPNEPLYWTEYYNSQSFDRGNYARPVGPRDIISGYLQWPGADGVLGELIDACTGVAVASIYSYSLGNGVVEFYTTDGTFEINKRYYVIVNPSISGIPVGRIIHQETITGNPVIVGNGVIRGVYQQFNGLEDMNYITLKLNDRNITGNLIYEIWKCDPKNLRNRTLIGGGTNAGLVGTGAGNFNIGFNVDKRVAWGRGDVLLYTFSLPTPGDTMSYRLRVKSTNTWAYYEAPGVKNIDRAFEPDIDIFGYEVSYSEMLEGTNNGLVEVTAQNENTFDLVPGGTSIRTLIDANMWQSKQPMTYEDIEIAPGEFTRLTNAINKETKLETNYVPSYAHDHLQHFIMQDNLKIQGVDYIQRNDYSYDYSNRHFGLAKGMITLTERKSIYRNTI
jgi:hypothetical protein